MQPGQKPRPLGSGHDRFILMNLGLPLRILFLILTLGSGQLGFAANCEELVREF